MKPSEYLYNEDFMVLNNTHKLKIIDKLDKQFIDREELKNEINEKICQINDCLGEFSYTKKYKQIQEEKIVLLKEILELINK